MPSLMSQVGRYTAAANHLKSSWQRLAACRCVASGHLSITC